MLPVVRFISWLKVGIVAIGIALGGIVANYIDKVTASDGTGVFIIILFGGISMIIAHLIEKKQEAKASVE